MRDRRRHPVTLLVGVPLCAALAAGAAESAFTTATAKTTTLPDQPQCGGGRAVRNTFDYGIEIPGSGPATPGAALAGYLRDYGMTGRAEAFRPATESASEVRFSARDDDGAVVALATVTRSGPYWRIAEVDACLTFVGGVAS